MFRFFRYTSLIVFLGCCLVTWNFGSTALGQTVHVILAADGADGQIGSAVKTDLEKMIELFQTNVPAANLSLLTLDAETMTPDGILRSVETLNVNSNDTVVFYYSGHGAFDTKTQKQFFALTERGNLYREMVVAKIAEKSPRLSVLLTDCCNNNVNVAGTRRTGVSNVVKTPNNFSPLFENLFVFCKGTVDLTSSKPGEFSWAIDSVHGSVFTLAFVELSNNNKTNGDLYWKEFAEKLGSRTQEIFLEKVPRETRTKAGQTKQSVYVHSLPGMADVNHDTQASAIPDTAPRPSGPRLGLRAVDYVGNGVTGVRVTEIVPNSPAAKAGILVGEIVTEINGGEVKNETTYSDAVDGSPKTMEMKLIKDGSNRTITVELGW